MEYVKLSGFRLDGRRPMEMRHMQVKIGAVVNADGSAIFEIGNTKVIAAVYGPREAIYRNTSCHLANHGGLYTETLNAMFSGTRSACIIAATMALADAGIPICDLVTSCTAVYLSSTPLLDLNYLEDSAGGPDVTVGLLAMMDKVTLLQMDAKLPMDIFENVLQLAMEGCKAIANLIRQVLLETTQKLEYLCGT